MDEAVSGGVRTTPLVVLCDTWEFALGYATTPGHTVKPRVAREDGPDGARWAVHVQVPCGARHRADPSAAAETRPAPRATGPDAGAFWRLLRER